MTEKQEQESDDIRTRKILILIQCMLGEKIYNEIASSKQEDDTTTTSKDR